MKSFVKRAVSLTVCAALALSIPLSASAQTPKSSANGIAMPMEWNASSTSVAFEAEIPANGVYAVYVTYMAHESKSEFIEFDVSVTASGETQGLKSVKLERPLAVSPPMQDAQGNQVRTRAAIANKINTALLRETSGARLPWLLTLNKGTASFTLTGKRTDLKLIDISVKPWAEPLPYTRQATQLKNAAEGVKIEAEDVSLVSDSFLSAQYERSSPAISPSDAGRLLLNIAGGDNWSSPGQWMEWEINAPEDGLYALRIKARQASKGGLSSYRKIYIDGLVPCAEAAAMAFEYSPDWQLTTLTTQTGEEILLPLTKGPHTLRMEVEAGPLAKAVKEIQDILLQLGNSYRQIVMVTGTTPDKNRDYALHKLIPGLIEAFEACSARLKQEKQGIERLSGQAQGDELVTITTLYAQLDSFVQNPETIPLRLLNFKNNIDNTSIWMSSLSQQPLDLDYLLVDAPNIQRTVEKAGFLETAAYNLKGLWASFFHNYDISSTDKSQSAELEVWVGLGRDQLLIVQELVNEYFTPQTGIEVNLSQAQQGTMFQQGITEAIMAGKGPDVMLFSVSNENAAQSNEPASLAMRGALLRLDGLEGFEKLSTEFRDEAFIPYRYNGANYGVPLMQQFPMMFYRTDILEELGLAPPKTWEELYAMIPVIQRKNMQVGVPSGDQTFATFLLQQGGGYYNDSKTATALTDNRAVECFTRYSRLFSDYGLPLSYNFFNRFVSGEMPIGIVDYVEYMRLVAAAPEIAGMWEMAPIPGTLGPSGSLDISAYATSGRGGFILADTKSPANAWSFLRWFASADMQAEFGKRIEAVLGPGGRYPAANSNAVEMLPWLASELEILKLQWENIYELPQPPGSYYTRRNLANAFRQVVLNGKNPREMLDKYMSEVDRELERKRGEYSSGANAGGGEKQ